MPTYNENELTRENLVLFRQLKLSVSTTREVTPNTILNIMQRVGMIRRNDIGNGYVFQQRNVNRAYLLERFAFNGSDSLHFHFNTESILEAYYRQLMARQIDGCETSTSTLTAPVVSEARMVVNRYHYSQTTNKVQENLDKIENDYDNIKRSFGIEYEIFNLTNDQKQKLMQVLRNLPEHEIERDASLGCDGVEIVFYPMNEKNFVKVVTTLKEFVDTNRVVMGRNEATMAGMHITYGVSNATSTKQDIQIRLNKIALLLRSIATKEQIKALFGRDFGLYRQLPDAMNPTTSDHSNAFSNYGRNETCYECRLSDYRCNALKMVEFLKATEYVFTRQMNAFDLQKIYSILNN